MAGKNNQELTKQSAINKIGRILAEFDLNSSFIVYYLAS